MIDAQKTEIGLQPPPGIYLNVPAAQYFAWPYMSKSGLSDFAKSPALWYGRQTGAIPWKTTPSQIMGTATNLLWVEQKESVTDSLILPPEDLPKSGKKRDAWIESLPPGIEPITSGQLHRAGCMAEALLHNERAMQLRSRAVPEVSLVWRCPFTKIMLKGRPDLVDFDEHILSDLKTTKDIREWSFDRDCSDYNYHWQLHLYTQGLVANGAGAYQDWFHWLITVANSQPHGVGCRPMPLEALELAESECYYHLQRWLQCRTDNHWPADLLDEKEIELPRWRYKFTGRIE